MMGVYMRGMVVMIMVMQMVAACPLGSYVNGTNCIACAFGSYSVSTNASDCVFYPNASTIVVQSFSSLLSEARFSRTLPFVGGSVVIYAGGYNESGASSAVDMLDLGSGLWSTASLSSPRYDYGATLLLGSFFIAAGG